MTVQFITGDLLTGRRLQSIPALAGSWSDVLNGVGDLQCVVPMTSPDVQRLELSNSAVTGKTFLAAVDGDTVLQAGPIRSHEFSHVNGGQLRLTAGGMWSYFDRRALLPVLGGRLPSDPTTDTTFRIAEGTARSYQGIIVALLQQAMSWPNGGVPIVLPSPIAGDRERDYRGIDVAPVGQRIRELTQIEDGPDFRLQPRWTSDRQGIEWVAQIGTPTAPRLSSSIDQIFNVGLADSSVSDLSVDIDGSRLGSQAFSIGGRATDEALSAVSLDPKLLDAGFPLWDLVDSAHSTASKASTLQGYADELVMTGRTSEQSWSFAHSLAQTPYLSAFSVGDFARVRVHESPYLEKGEHRMRLVARSGDVDGSTVKLNFAPEVI